MQESTRRQSFATFPGLSRYSGGGFGPGGGGEDWDALEFDRDTEFHILTRDLAETAGDINSTGSGLNNMIGDFDNYLPRQGSRTGPVKNPLLRLPHVAIGEPASALLLTVASAPRG